jgi:hypothetical protein
MNLYYKLKELPNRIKYFIQRGRRGYSDWDVWGMDIYLAEVIIGMLDELIKSHCGRPMIVKTYKEWVGILKKMKYGFKEYYKWENMEVLPPYNKYMEKLKKSRAELKQSFRLMEKYFINLWD